MIVRAARETVPEPYDLRAVEAAFSAATQALNEFDGSAKIAARTQQPLEPHDGT